MLLFRRWRRWQRQQPAEHWLADSEIPEVTVRISVSGRATFDHFSEFRQSYGIPESQVFETSVHLRPQPDGTVAVAIRSDVPELPPTDIGLIAAEDAEPILASVSRLPADQVARAELVARGSERSGYEATVRGYPPDIMRMWSAGYLRDA